MRVLGCLLLALAMMAPAQTRKPNFSGKWELVLAKSNFAKIPPPKKVTNLIEHQEPKLKVKSTMVITAGEFSDELHYVTTGSEITNVSHGMKMISKSRWEKLELVTETIAENPNVEFNERWRLADGGKTFINDRVIRMRSGDVVQKLVFEKK